MVLNYRKTQSHPLPLFLHSPSPFPFFARCQHFQELDATAVYHGLATKHPLVPKLARQMRSDERGGEGGRRRSSAINSLAIGVGEEGAAGMGRNRSSLVMGVGRGSEEGAGGEVRNRRSSKVGFVMWRREERGFYCVVNIYIAFYLWCFREWCAQESTFFGGRYFHVRGRKGEERGFHVLLARVYPFCF